MVFTFGRSSATQNLEELRAEVLGVDNLIHFGRSNRRYGLRPVFIEGIWRVGWQAWSVARTPLRKCRSYAREVGQREWESWMCKVSNIEEHYDNRQLCYFHHFHSLFNFRDNVGCLVLRREPVFIFTFLINNKRKKITKLGNMVDLLYN